MIIKLSKVVCKHERGESDCLAAQFVAGSVPAPARAPHERTFDDCLLRSQIEEP
ncbi:MAG: hypothetical protein QG553_845, partial [Patescibacteria group bacterium]|nr:hypothetical protein [Patescibacteria group bacterium]